MAVLAADSQAHSAGKSGGPESEGALVLGEIRTGLLRNSGSLDSDACARLLALLPQQRVRRWERPVRHAASPPVLTGVDCAMPSLTGRGLRGVGTVATDVRITGGRILQAATRVRLVRAAENRRLPWSHHLTRPGVVETWGAIRVDDVVDGFLRPQARPGTLDLAGPGTHRMNALQASGLLDGAHVYRPERIRLRWAAVVATGPAGITFALESPQLHTLRVSVPPELAVGVDDLCQDLALHDWLLCCVISLLDEARIGARDRAGVVATLAPAIDLLLQAWLPGARIGAELMAYWAEIDRRSGLSRQWDTAVARIRDQVALATLEVAVSAGQSPPTRLTLPSDHPLPVGQNLSTGG